MSNRVERAKAKGQLAASLAATGAGIGGIAGGPIGATIGATAGAITGLVVADTETVFTIDMVAIPAFQAYMITGTPSQMVYIKAGETLLPTGGNVDDVEEALAEVAAPAPKKKRKKLNAYQKFTKSFQFRKKKRTETQKEYFAARSKALSRAWKKAKKQG